MKVTEICVQPDTRRIKLTVEMPDPDRFHTSQVPHLPRMLFRLFPRLAHHKCDNDLGLSFRQECRQTEIPHLFEHLIMELQAQAQYADVLILRGETEWNWRVDPRGRFHVYVEYENELLAVGAIRLAERILSALDQRDLEAIDTPREIERLQQVARLGRELMAGDGGADNGPGSRSWSTVTFTPTAASPAEAT